MVVSLCQRLCRPVPVPTLARQSAASVLSLSAVCRRLIYSSTGVWPCQLTNEVRLSVERQWMERCCQVTPLDTLINNNNSNSVINNNNSSTDSNSEINDSNSSSSSNNSSSSSSSSDKKIMYVLSMFPYPSGRLHMGHVRVYSIGDTIARYHRLCGKQVFQPMGWDAFGLPAENAALQRGIAPEHWTRSNIDHMRRQLRRLALSVDWSCELDTSRPSYYRWTQWLFLQLLRANLVYTKCASVNWDPVDGTVLADEQVDARGRSWRSGAVVQRRVLRQWFVRTTSYSHRLLAALENDGRGGGGSSGQGGGRLVDWHDVIDLQRNWIGRCDGWRLDLQVCDEAGCRLDSPLSVWLPDLLLLRSAVAVVVRPGHHLAQHTTLSASSDSHRRPLTVCIPTGASGATCRQVPLLVSNDDHLFPAGQDVAVQLVQPTQQQQQQEEEEESLELNTARDFTALSVDELALLLGASRASSHLQDWPISRQRYWGTPIPIVHCTVCGAVPVPESQLPVQLPPIDQLQPAAAPAAAAGGGEESSNRPLQRLQLSDATDWLKTDCPRCGRPATRESDTMDTFFDSAWYYLRYLDANSARQPFSVARARALMPVDIYVGGKEHAILHLYFARFVAHFLHSLGLLATPEPFTRLLTQGHVMGRSFRLASTGVYLPAEQVTVTGDSVVAVDTGEPVLVQWEKMSKSKLNGVEPDGVLSQYGADTTRLFLLARVTPKSRRNWSEQDFPSLLSWQQKLWQMVGSFLQLSQQQTTTAAAISCCERQQQLEQLATVEAEIREQRNTAVRCASVSMAQAYNISVALTRLQTFTKQLRAVPPDVWRVSGEYQRALGDLIVMLSSVMPCLAAEMWSAFAQAADRTKCCYNWEGSVHEQMWPELDMDGTVIMQIQVNRNPVELQITRKQLERLTEPAAAVAMALQLPEVRQQLQLVDRAQWHVEPPWQALLRLWGPPPPGFDLKAHRKKNKKLRLRS